MTTTTDTERLDWLMTRVAQSVDNRRAVDPRVILLHLGGLNSREAVDMAMLTENLTRTPLLSIAELDAALGAVNFTKPFNLEPSPAVDPSFANAELPIDHPANAWVRAAIEAGRHDYYQRNPVAIPTSAYTSVLALAYSAEEASSLRTKLDNAVLERTDSEADCEKADANLARYRRMEILVRGASGILSMAIETFGEGSPS